MSDDVIDLPEALERVQDDKGFLVELLDVFQEDFLKKRAVLAEALTTKDIMKVREVAHSMKGSSGNISAKGIYAVCLDLEKLAKTNSTDGMQDLARNIDVQFAGVQAFAAKLKKEFAG